ncbi:MAG: hypothetical protein ACRD29_19400 [Acidimicrobiales bacterium]
MPPASGTSPGAQRAGAPARGANAPARPLTNLDHIDWLGAETAPPAQVGHTTYRLAEEPSVGVLWTYADLQPDGTYRRIGGGAYDPETDTWSQGAFNADDLSRAAIVYLRHWQATEDESSRDRAYQLLRGLTYLQTAAGPHAGNVVLWMQPDGTLNPSADPPDSPDPSDSGASYWLARTIWALGEAYPAFGDVDPAFAGFLRDRLDLALDAVERQVLVRYGQWLDIDGTPVPAWLITDGADATGEALLGLAAYVSATGDARARQVLQQLGEGVAAMRSGTTRKWPFGAILPWAQSQAVWHAWGGLAPAGMADAFAVTGDRTMRNAALSDTAAFTPHLLIAAGPENGWLPAPTDRVQIAYGAHSRVESLLATAEAADRPGLRKVAGIAAAWFFGSNPAAEAMYDPPTGRTYDGVTGDGVVNRNAGAESTIHGLLTMVALDQMPHVAALAAVAAVAERHTWTLVEAEAGQLGPGAEIHQPESAWTGESLWSGGAGVRLLRNGTVTIPVTAVGAHLLLPVVMLDPSAGATTWTTPHREAGVVRHAAVGPQGDSPAPGLLAMETLPRTVRDVDSVTVRAVRGEALIDALLVQPEVEHLVLSSETSATALLRNFAHGNRTVVLSLPAGTTADVEVFDATGRRVTHAQAPADRVEVTIPGGGFAVVRS